jgi:hypothetical protein
MKRLELVLTFVNVVLGGCQVARLLPAAKSILEGRIPKLDFPDVVSTSILLWFLAVLMYFEWKHPTPERMDLSLPRFLVGTGLILPVVVSLEWSPAPFWRPFVGILTAYGLVWVVDRVYLKASGRRGFDDATLAACAVMGCSLGPAGAFWGIGIGCYVGTIAAAALILKRQTADICLPMAPFLVIGTIVVIFTPVVKYLFSAWLLSLLQLFDRIY